MIKNDIWISQCEKVTLALLGAFSLRFFFFFLKVQGLGIVVVIISDP